MTTESAQGSLLDKIRQLVPATYREAFYRATAAVVTLLLAVGVFNTEEAALWTQLGIALVTILFALLYTTSQWRTVLYLVVGPAGALLMAYGIGRGVDWAVVVSAVGQIFGITTAAAKAVSPVKTAPVRKAHEAP